MHFITSTLPIKTLRSGSNNVIYSATAHTLGLVFRLKNVVQQILHKLLSFLTTWQEFCQEISFIVICVHISHTLFIPHHSFMDEVIWDALQLFLQCQIRDCHVCKHRLVIPIYIYGCLNWNAHRSQLVP